MKQPRTKNEVAKNFQPDEQALNDGVMLRVLPDYSYGGEVSAYLHNGPKF